MWCMGLPTLVNSYDRKEINPEMLEQKSYVDLADKSIWSIAQADLEQDREP